ncbi:K Homology domain, type 1 [Dillenia turbinata]|uniref:K Homology domain, type 1 n=1 Tax=Dillenia turbinata TaxID=194707 RepID=A0AAN8W3I9_9MAGN
MEASDNILVPENSQTFVDEVSDTDSGAVGDSSPRDGGDNDLHARDNNDLNTDDNNGVHTGDNKGLEPEGINDMGSGDGNDAGAEDNKAVVNGGNSEHGADGVGNVMSAADNDLKVGSVGAEKRWPGWPGENVFRMLVPVQKVGSIIGRKGEYIRKTFEETKARIKVLDARIKVDGPRMQERVVLISAKEEPDASISPAMDALLRIHKRLVNVECDSSEAGATVLTRILIAATQAGILIGKQGSTIKSVQDASGCIVRVLGEDHLPLCALPDDNVVEIQGEPAGVHKAVELIASHLRKFLVDRSVVGIFEMQMQMPNAGGNQNMPPNQPWGPPQVFGMNAGGGPDFRPNPQYTHPHQFDNYYPPAELPPSDKQPQQVPPIYGREAPVGFHSSGAPPQPTMVSKVAHNIQIPLSYADAVIGPSGANISYIRRTSGATIVIQESRDVPGEVTVEINGSTHQNSIAEASRSAYQNPMGAPVSQEHNCYPATNGSLHTSPPSNAAGPGVHPSLGDYGSVYGTNYGVPAERVFPRGPGSKNIAVPTSTAYSMAEVIKLGESSSNP